MTPYYQDALATLYCGDCRDIAPGLAGVGAVVSDPPYCGEIDAEWDNQWRDKADYLAWLEAHVAIWATLIPATGSLYLFASPQLAAQVEVMVARHLHVLNQIVWRKESKGGGGKHNHQSQAACRRYYPQTERIIFAEQYGSDNAAAGLSGYVAACDRARGFVFEPLRAYLAGEWARAGLAKHDAELATGTQMAGHWFTQVQWALPTANHYATLRDYANRQGGDYLRREYEDLRREYEDLRREYEDLRRPFNVTGPRHFTDVWDFTTVQAYSGKHPCEKPLGLMKHIIEVSTRPGDLILDPFAGSGTTMVAAMETGRRCIGIELDAGYCAVAARRLANTATQPALPDAPPAPAATIEVLL